MEGKTANTPRLGPVSTSRQRIAELARQANDFDVGMAVAIAWLPGPAGTRRRVAKLSVEEPDAALRNPHVRICGGPGSATTLVYPTVQRRERLGGLLSFYYREAA